MRPPPRRARRPSARGRSYPEYVGQMILHTICDADTVDEGIDAPPGTVLLWRLIVTARGVGKLSKTVQKAVLLACSVAVLARILVISGLIGMFIVLIDVEVWSLLYLVLVSLVIVAWGGYLGFAMTLRCPACRRRFLIETRERKHGAARRRSISIIGERRSSISALRIRLMYCGTMCRVQ